MRITALPITVRKIATPGTELPRAAAVLQEDCTAMLACHAGLISFHLFRVRCPPCHAALGRAEPLLPMPGSLLKRGAALWALAHMGKRHRCRRFFYYYGIPLAIGLDRIDGHAQRRSNLSVAGAGCPELCDLFFLLLSHAFSPFQKAYRMLPSGDKRRKAGIRTPSEQIKKDATRVSDVPC